MNFLGMILPGLFRVIEELVPDEDERNRLKVGLQSQLLQQQTELIRQQGQVVQAEARSQSWITRNWRPITMLTFVFIITYRVFFGPLIAAIFGIPVETLVLPMDPAIEGEFFNLVTLGLTGYVIGRSGESIARHVFSNRQNDLTVDHLLGRRTDTPESS